MMSQTTYNFSFHLLMLKTKDRDLQNSLLDGEITHCNF